MSEDGFIYIRLLDGRGGSSAISKDRLPDWKPEDGALWVHMDYESPAAQQWLNERSDIEPLLIEALTSDDIRPRSLCHEDSLLLVLRCVNSNPGSEPEDMVAVRIWAEPGRIFTLRHRKVLAVEDIVRALEAGKGPRDTGHFVRMLADRITDRIDAIVEEVMDESDRLEESVMRAESGSIRSSISEQRRTIIALRRYIAPQREAFNRLHSDHPSWMDMDFKTHAHELADRTTRLLEDLDMCRERASISSEELTSRLSEQMSKTMYLLSIVAALFLPLGFVTGLLGINVGGIPGSDNPSGFIMVCVMLAIIALVQFIIYRAKKWL